MRSWISAAVAISAVGMVAPSAVRAAPATGQTAIERSAAGASSIEDIRYVVRCHRVRVWRNSPMAAGWGSYGAVIAATTDQTAEDSSCR